MKNFLMTAVILIACKHSFTQIDARLFRYPDVSANQVCFVYGGDIWIVPKTGGTAYRVTSSTGEESYPRFSPDGKTMAFTASYDGNADVYTMKTSGSVPVRLTWHAMPDRVVDWHPDGKRILIASPRESGSQAFRQLYLLPVSGGLPEKLPVPYGELASFSPDGEKLAYVTKITENYPFKRYRGGLASDILVFDLKNQTAENITKTEAAESKPIWHKNRIYFVSDQDKSKRRNIWVFDNDTKKKTLLTNFSGADINHMSAGPEDIVFEAGGRLYLLNLETHKYTELKVNVIADNATLMPRTVNVGNSITSFALSPDAKRSVFEARGELFSIPAENGVIINLTNTSGAFERNPSCSPNGRWLAYWSDESGENEIHLRDNSNNSSKKITSAGKGMGWQLFWSPDNKHIAYINDMQEIRVLSFSGIKDAINNVVIDKTTHQTYSGLQNFTVSWSPDSKWLAYSKGNGNQNESVFLYNFDKKKVYRVTSGYYNDNNPVFDKTGKYLFFTTNRNFSPTYSNFDNTWIYPNSTQIAVTTLDVSTQSLLFAKNDEIKISDTILTSDQNKGHADSLKPKPLVGDLFITPERMEERMEILPVPAGNIGKLTAVDGNLIFLRYPNTGAPQSPPSIMVFDIDKREQKTLLANASDYSLSKDGKKILARDPRGFGLVPVNPDQKMDKLLRTDEIEMILNPKEEWKQIFNDTWRRYRDFFYDPNMHQVNWNNIRKDYGTLIEDAITRWDVNNIQLEMISELSAGHTYANGGDVEQGKNRTHGFLGIDWILDNKAYKIKRIVRPAAWDNEVRSPLELSGINVKEGDYILSVNGRELDPALDPYAMFEGLAGKAVSLRVNSHPRLQGSREIIIRTLHPQEEARLRHLEWIEMNRKKVDELSDGQLGYMYMPNTGSHGQTELMRQFYAQIDKKGFVIDERFNAGGQLGDRFIEMLNRPTLYNLAWRNADVTVWPTRGNDAPKVMLINGWAGSGGDAFPWAFQQLNLGPVIGERTLGILVGPATGHRLIDGGSITVPDARLYGADGKWFAEGFGIEPGIQVWDDPAQLAKGIDPQLVRAVEEALKLIKEKPRLLYPRPAFEDRSSKGIKD